jgi:hypothetical protein
MWHASLLLHIQQLHERAEIMAFQTAPRMRVGPLVCAVLCLQEDLSETTPAVGALCKLLLSDQLQEIQQFVPQIVQVRTAAGQSVDQQRQYSCIVSPLVDYLCFVGILPAAGDTSLHTNSHWCSCAVQCRCLARWQCSQLLPPKLRLVLRRR